MKPALLIPEWTIRLLVVLAILGFPVVIILSWIYDVKDPKESNYYLFEKETNKKYIVKTPTQLYNILKKLKLFKSI